MTKVKYYRKLVPANSFDIPAIETWLTYMAEQGFFLHSAGLRFAKFYKDTPKKLHFRLEPVGDAPLDFYPYHPPASQQDLFAEFGWNYVGLMCKSFFVYVSEEENPVELHTDPALQIPVFKKFYASKRTEFIVCLVLCVFILLGHSWRSGIEDAVLYNNFASLGLIPFYLMLVYQTFQEFHTLSSMKKHLEGGIPLSHRGDFKKNLRSSRFFGVLWILLFLVIFVYPITSLYRESKETDSSMGLWGITSPLPIVTLETLEENVNTEAYVQTQPTLYARSSYLAPVQIEIWQNAIVTDQNRVDGSQYAPSLGIHYVRLQADWLAKPFLSSLQGFKDAMPIETDLFDSAWISKTEYRQNLYLAKNHTVLEITYYGNEDLESKIDFFAPLVEKEYPLPEKAS